MQLFRFSPTKCWVFGNSNKYHGNKKFKTNAYYTGEMYVRSSMEAIYILNDLIWNVNNGKYQITMQDSTILTNITILLPYKTILLHLWLGFGRGKIDPFFERNINLYVKHKVLGLTLSAQRFICHLWNIMYPMLIMQPLFCQLAGRCALHKYLDDNMFHKYNDVDKILPGVDKFKNERLRSMMTLFLYLFGYLKPSSDVFEGIRGGSYDKDIMNFVYYALTIQKKESISNNRLSLMRRATGHAIIWVKINSESMLEIVCYVVFCIHVIFLMNEFVTLCMV